MLLVRFDAMGSVAFPRLRSLDKDDEKR